VNWLRELLSLWTLENRIVTAVDIEILDERSLVAAVKTVALNLGQDELHHDIKAVTYHQADVKPVAHGWEATVIFDV
jgi:SHS2 domain-containing protein